MSDDEIRDLLDLGVQDPDSGDELTAEQLWTAGRRQRTRGRAWLGALGAVAAAASILGMVWAQGLAGGDAAPPPADETPDTVPGPTSEVDSGAHGEPFFARFEQANAEHAEQLSGASRPATPEDLQGTWVGPDTEVFVFEGNEFTATLGGCSVQRRTVALTPESRLRTVGLWEGADDVGECLPEQPLIPWGPALNEEPLLSLDGGTLVVSGLDGTTEEPRVQVALTLGQVDETGFNWADVPSATGVTPITLGNDFALSLSGDDDETLGSINLVMLEERPGIAAAAQNPDVEVIAYPGTCPQVMESSLRSDGVLLAGPPRPMPACTDGSAAILPPSEPSPAAVALLRSGPTVAFDGDTLVVSGTIPESLLEEAQGTPDDLSQTSEPEEDDATPAGTISIPNALGSSAVIVMSEGGWTPSGVLSPLVDEDATGRHWLPVDTEVVPPIVGDDVGGERGLTYDGTNWRVRECSIDVTVPGRLEDSILVATGDPVVVADPDPGAACVTPELMPDQWAEVLTSRPRLSTDGQILVLVGRTDDGPLAPVGMALLGDGVTDPRGGPTTVVTAEDLAAGLTEVPGEVAVEDIGVSDHLDLQPGHTTTLSLQDGIVSLDVGCDEPLRGPAWFSQIGPDDDRWQLTAALPQEPACAGPDQAAGEAELWRQMLAQGTFLHHFGDYVIVDAMVDAEWASAGGS